MSSEIRHPRRGVAMFLVLGVVIFFTMLGFMGMQLASRDSGAAGSVLDIRSRDVATRSGISLALGALSSDEANTSTQLNAFIADSIAGSPRQWFNFSTNPITLQSSDPGWYVVGQGSDESAVKVKLVSLDIGDAAGAPSDGIRITLECQAKGRNAEAISVVASYRVMGMQVPLLPGSTPTNNFAIYLDGAMANTNMGATVNGDVYISGNTHLNGPATFTINGSLRTAGDFSSDAPVSASGNSAIGGNLKTNGSAPMTFSKSLVIKGGIDVMNASLTVTQNLDVQGTGPMGSWNNTGTLSVGGQFWYRSECRDIAAAVTVGGNAFFDGCLRLTGSVARSFANLYVGRSGGSTDDYMQSGTAAVSGSMGNWHAGAASTKFYTDGTALTINGQMISTPPVDQRNGGPIWIKGAGQFLSGISGIASASGIRVDGTTYIHSTDQHGDFNGGMSLGNSLLMKGNINSDFGQNGSPRRWAFQAGAPSKSWLYDGSPCIHWSAPNPRVTSATTTNTTGCNTGTATPAALFSAPTPLEPTAYAADTFTSNQLDLDRTKSWNQPQNSDFTKVTGIIDLTWDSLTAAGCNTDNITVADFHKMYARWKRSDGWMVVRIGASSSIGSLGAPGGTFTGKALWLIEKSVNINGQWPGSTTNTDYQFIWVRGAGSLGAFGSASNFAGYIRYEPVMSGQLQWGTATLTGAMHYLGDNSSVTGNGAKNLTINNSQAVFDAIGTAFPGALIDPSGSSGSTTAGSSRTVAARQSDIQFVPVGEYR